MCRHGFVVLWVLAFSVNAQQKNVEIPQAAENRFVEGMGSYITEDYNEAAETFKSILSDYTPTAGIYHILAKTEVARKDLYAAEMAARKSLELEKGNTYYEEFLADILSREEEYEPAIDLYKTLIKQKPLEMENYLLLAEIYEKLNESNEAIKVYDLLERNLGVEEEVSMRKQQLYLQQNKVSEAIKEGGKLMESQPLKPEYALNQAQILIQNQELEEAEELLKKFLKTNADTGEAHVMLAEIYRLQHNQDACDQELSAALMNPKLSPEIKVRLLGTYIQLADNSRNEQLLTKAIGFGNQLAKDHPDMDQVYIFLGDLYVKTNQPEKARANYEKAIGFNKSIFAVWVALVEMDLELNDNEALAKHTLQGTDYFPNQAFLWYHHALANYRLGEYKESEIALEEAKFLSEGNKSMQLSVWILSAKNALAQNAVEDAERAYTEALKIDDSSPLLLANYSRFLAKTGRNLEKAEDISIKGYKRNPENLEWIKACAEVFHIAGKTAEAEAVFNKSLQQNVLLDGEAYELFGDIVAKENKESEALEYWQMAQSLGNRSTALQKKISELK
ncbi:tetratricopeptide repeat protein [Marinilongibacter aquaticus]|uniref:tetratricopeptide repeat protein n=1 Tax=Marinilongibacter aquaticus TaxID=2975157 RepID=UPI0021BD8A74|nr:tetratricopeptide repeat protein [Marinilongibacter aquaticus]UBM57727.1 tetratricopeptide repeat protein [Marinilongibacter aquaticus]